MPLAARISTYWLAVAVATGVWFIGIDALEMWPLPVQLALTSMLPMAGLWWHLVLFQDTLKARKAARLAARAPAGAPPVAAAPAALPEAALRGALRQVREDAAALAWDAALQRELAVRIDFDAEFARAAAPLGQAERAILLLAARGPVVRKRLALAAELLVRDRGEREAADPMHHRLRERLDAISPAIGAEFALVMATAADLDPIEVAHRLLARREEQPEEAAAQAALALFRQAAMALEQDGRLAVRRAMGAHLAGQGPVRALLEIYLATAKAPASIALAALGAAPGRAARTA